MLSANKAASDAQARVLAKALEASLEIIGRKCEITVEFDQVFPVGVLNRGQPVIERLDYTSARLAKATIASVNNANPTVLSGSGVGNRSGVVVGAIIDNEPLKRANRLGDEGIDCGRKICLLISNRRDDDISRWLSQCEKAWECLLK